MSLSCAALDLRIGGRTLLSKAHIAMHAGRLTAVLGPNGAGKSTLLSLLCGQRAPDFGEVLLDGHPLAGYAPSSLAVRRAVMPQESSVAFEFTAKEIVALGRFPHRHAPTHDEDAIIERALALTDMTAMSGRVLNTLSGGEKSRVQLARALAQIWERPGNGAIRWLLLDEPTAALDLAHQHAAMRLLKEWAGQGVGVVAVLHDLNLARRYADDVVVLDGQAGIHQGPADEVLSQHLIERVWGMPCQPVTARDGAVQYLFG